MSEYKQYSAQQDLTLIISFSWEAVVKYLVLLYQVCYAAPVKITPTAHLKHILDCMWFCLLRGVKDL